MLEPGTWAQDTTNVGKGWPRTQVRPGISPPHPVRDSSYIYVYMYMVWLIWGLGMAPELPKCQIRKGVFGICHVI